jgi:hypothetical protein
MTTDFNQTRSSNIEVQNGTKAFRFDLSTSKRSPTKVRFDPLPKVYVVPNELTSEEIEASWWSRSEIRSGKRVCRWIAGEARRLGYTAQIVDAVGQITASRKFCINLDVGTDLIDNHVAKRFVRYSSRFTTLRGLEYQICNTLRQDSQSFRAKICCMQRLPGMNDEYLRRVSRNFSRYDRIMARLLGEADALYLLDPLLHEETQVGQDPILHNEAINIDQ